MHIIIWIIVILVVLGLIISLAEWVIDNIVPILLIATYIVGLIFWPKVMVALTIVAIGLLIVWALIKGAIRWIKKNVLSKFHRKHRRKPITEQEVKEKRRRSLVQVDDSLPEDVRTVINNGNRFLIAVREFNDDIEDEVVSKKLDELEGLTYQIFHELGRNPGKLHELDRLNNYYLPTIEKLIRSYAELDNYEYQESNLRDIKSEISNMLDDVNAALLKLVNDLFVYEKIDVQSDITVMKSMFERDGISK